MISGRNASTTSHTPSVAQQDSERVLSYWFGGTDASKKWFAGGKIDHEIKEKFSDMMRVVFLELGREKSISKYSWVETPRSSLALVILLDQFTRNVFRGTKDSFAKDSIAREVASNAIAHGFDRKLEPYQQAFLYMPYMHAEDIAAQVNCLAQFELLISRCEPGSAEEKYAQQSYGAARKHRDIILKFGRFPGRNQALGRESTAEEVEFLKDNPQGL